MDLIIETTIVFIIPDNKPSFLTTNILVNGDVIKDESSITEAVTLQQFAQISYGNGYRLDSFDRQVVLRKGYEAESKTINDELSEAAENLADVLKNFDVESVGINFDVFYKGKVFSDFVAINTDLNVGTVSLHREHDGFIFNYALTTARVNPGQVHGIVARINCDGQVKDGYNRSEHWGIVKGFLERREELFTKAIGDIDALLS